MADSVCGPSNPLQNFQKKATVDRSLQQDRFASRTGPSQSFRSHHGVNAGVLDPEFEAFQAGLPSSSTQPNFTRPQDNFPSRAQIDWASDFQQLHVSSPPPLQSQYHAPVPSAPWHLEFQHHQPKQSPSTQLYQQPALNSQFQANTSLSYISPHTRTPWAPMQSLYPQRTQNTSYSTTRQFSEVETQADAEAFDREFEARATELLRQAEEEQLQRGSTELGQDVLLDGPDVLESFDSHFRTDKTDVLDFDAFMNSPDPIISQRDPLHQAIDQQQDNTKPAMSKPASDDDLARTAGELLERVADNTSTKFRQSEFLGLMTQLRDKEARVDGDQIILTSPHVSPNSDSAQDLTEKRKKWHNHVSPLGDDFIACKVFNCPDEEEVELDG